MSLKTFSRHDMSVILSKIALRPIDWNLSLFYFTFFVMYKILGKFEGTKGLSKVVDLRKDNTVTKRKKNNGPQLHATRQAKDQQTWIIL